MLVVGGSDLTQRTLSALVLVPVVLGITWLGGPLFLLMWGLAGLVILHEWAGVARLENERIWFAVAGGSLVSASLLLYLGSHAYALSAVLLGAAACAFAVPRQSGWAVGGLLWAGATVLPVMALRGAGELGFVAVAFLYAVVWGTDIFAYFVGRAVGGPKLWPKVSPNKTRSGALGGFVAGMAAAWIVTLIWGLPFAWTLALVALAMSIAAQCGDLAESALKRLFGVKDASHLIPGHGGLLDRLDSFAGASVIAILIAEWRAPGSPAAGLLLW